MSNRKEDLRQGSEVEDMFMHVLHERNPGCVIYKSIGNFKEYDLKLIKQDESSITFEIKYDRMCASTGNVAIEKSYSGSDSGIYASTADFIIYYIDGSFCCNRRSELKEKAKGFPIVKGGDGMKSELILIPKSIFLSWGSIIGQ